MYGWFTGSMFCSSCIGALIWFSMIQSRTHLFQAIKSAPQFSDPQFLDMFKTTMSTISDSARWQIVVMLLSPLELLFTCIPMLHVLFRMLDFAAAHNNAGTPRGWLLAQKITVSLLLIGNAIGMVSAGLSTEQYLKMIRLIEDARTAFEYQNLDDALKHSNDALQSFQNGNIKLGMQQISEAVILLMIVFMFAAAGIMCARRIAKVFGNSCSSLHNAPPIERLRQQIVLTVAAVFLTSLLRTAYASFVATTNINQTVTTGVASCGGLFIIQNFCDANCFSR
jgi:hypothetical protein